MSQIRGTASYHMGNQHPFGGPGTTEATNDPSPLDAIREQTSKIEDFLDTISDPLKPCVLPAPKRSRSMLTVTDTSPPSAASSSSSPSSKTRSASSPNGATSCSTSTTTATVRAPLLSEPSLTSPVPYGITHVFLVINVIAMTVSSVMIIIRKHSEYAVLGLVSVVVVQALGYGLIFDLNFFLRNVSVIGGLLMVLSDSWVRKKIAGAGLPQMDEKDRKMYVQLAGRVLLICLFLGFVIAGEWTVWRVIVSLLGFVACIMVAVGFKAKFSAVILVLLLSVFNILVNNWWTVRSTLISGPV
jgi:uncharacterized membrane protein YphA (DoxX/SURF4 family)